MTRIVVDKSTDHTKPQSICFLPQYQRNLPRFVDNWKQVENKDSDLKVHVLYYAKWATCTRHFSFQKFCNKLAQHAEKIRKNCLGKEWWRVLVTVQYRPRWSTFRFVFYHNINVKENDFSERELKKVIARHIDANSVVWSLIDNGKLY